MQVRAFERYIPLQQELYVHDQLKVFVTSFNNCFQNIYCSIQFEIYIYNLLQMQNVNNETLFFTCPFKQRENGEKHKQQNKNKNTPKNTTKPKKQNKTKKAKSC